MRRIECVDEGRLSFLVRVQPRASRDQIVGWLETGELKVRVAAAPVDDNANRQLVRLLAGFLEVKRSEVTIAAGSHSRTKRVVVPKSSENRLLSVADI